MRFLPELFFGVAFIAASVALRRRMGAFRFINAFRRFVAIGFASLGTLAVIISLVWIGWPEVFSDEPAAPLWGKVAYAFLFGLAATLGVYLMLAPTYRPDLGDTMRLMSNEPWSQELERRRGRSWWTGDPRSPINGNLHRGSAI
jgi:hypothetical protein